MIVNALKPMSLLMLPNPCLTQPTRLTCFVYCIWFSLLSFPYPIHSCLKFNKLTEKQSYNLFIELRANLKKTTKSFYLQLQHLSLYPAHVYFCSPFSIAAAQWYLQEITDIMHNTFLRIWITARKEGQLMINNLGLYQVMEKGNVSIISSLSLTLHIYRGFCHGNTGKSPNRH